MRSEERREASTGRNGIGPIATPRSALLACWFEFQSPSRWGRCCILVLHLRQRELLDAFQSPSRWGRCCIPLPLRCIGGTAVVSVPFSMGTVLHLPKNSQVGRKYPRRFSPLLDGDGVASAQEAIRLSIVNRFQSPSRWGRCCIRS